MKRILTIETRDLTQSAIDGGCGECRTSCQSACKTSCGIANQQCENSAISSNSEFGMRGAGSGIHCYKLGGQNIVLDIASGSIHSVDDVAYDAIGMYESPGPDGITGRIKEKYPDLPECEISELVSDIEGLKRRGKLFSDDSFVSQMKSVGERPLKALCMNVSHKCNMTCSYCFAGKGEYGGGGLMSLDTGKRTIDFLIKNSSDRKNLDIDFFGGEPLLNWEVVKGIVRYARDMERGSDKLFRFTLTTNGLLIDDDVVEFTTEHMHNVVLSLDGRADVNDAMRKLPDGGGSYAAVLPKIKKLVCRRGGKGYYIRGTFTRENLDFVNDILHLADLGFNELSLEPVVTKPGEPHSLTMGDLPAICLQYEKLALEMVRRDKVGQGFGFYHYTLDTIRGPCVHKRLAGCGVGTEYLAVTPKGELYPCHQFVGDPKFLMGDIYGGILNKSLRNELSERCTLTLPECRDCWARYYCSGGCAANAYHASGSVTGTYELGCEMFKKRIECAIYIAVTRSVLQSEL